VCVCVCVCACVFHQGMCLRDLMRPGPVGDRIARELSHESNVILYVALFPYSDLYDLQAALWR